MQSDFDIIIIGGGLAGCCLALALAPTNLRVALVEEQTRAQRYSAQSGDRALALASGTVALLENLDMWQSLKPDATPIAHIHVSDQGHFGKTRLSAEREGVPALGYVITARIIEDLAARLVEEADHISLFCPARIAGISASAIEASVSLKSQQQSSILTAQLVVGADGGQSSVRKLLEIPQQITDYGQTAIVTTLKSSKHHAYTAYERFTPFGPLALLPTLDGQSSVVWTRNHEQAAALMSGSEDDFVAQLQACFGYRLGTLRLTAPRRSFPLSLIRAEQLYAGRAVMVGNAAHQLHPVAGQGFNLGLRDVMALAQQLATQSQNHQDIGEPDFLKRFAKHRHKDHDHTIGFTHNLVKLFSTESTLLAIARTAGLTLLDHFPPAKHFLAKQAMGLNR